MMEAAFLLLCAELLVVLVLIIPLPFSARQLLIKSFEPLKILWTPAKYFTVGMMIIWLLSLREMLSLQSRIDKASDGTELTAQLQFEVRLFRSQRNVYICGFAFLLQLVIYRVFVQLKEINQLTATKEYLSKQAKNTGDALLAAQEKLTEQEKAKEASAKEAPSQTKPVEDRTEAEDELEIANETIDTLRERNTKLIGELDTATKETEAIKRQAEGVTKEYERLMREKESLENKLADFELVLGDEVKKAK
mmetsp:Transcript_71288/g.141346  ORF Transcript_71288/g.141346 Transcript_71288/m.141346 type:complete len:250 (-) Transcript_71288:381-1130(-)